MLTLLSYFMVCLLIYEFNITKILMILINLNFFKIVQIVVFQQLAIFVALVKFIILYFENLNKYINNSIKIMNWLKLN